MSSILETALALAAAGMPALPLYAPDEGEKNHRGKRPRQNHWHSRPNTPEQIAFWFRQFPRSNLGLVTGALSGLICVDIDPRNGGEAWYQANKTRLAGGVEERTGGGGIHIWFRHPGRFIVSHRGKDGIAPGVELLADGGHQSVIAPSIHYTGKPYECHSDFIAMRDFEAETLPEWIATPIEIPERRTRRKETYSDNPADIAVCREVLKTAEPAWQKEYGGGGGDSRTIAVCMLGRDYDLSEEAFFPLISEWNERCIPPWDLGELRRKVRNAYGSAQQQFPGSRAPSKQFDQVDPNAPAPTQLSTEAAAVQTEELVGWQSKLRRKKGEVVNCVANVIHILQNDEKLRGLVRWSLFSHRVELAETPPWTRKTAPSAAWCDLDGTKFLAWLQNVYSPSFSAETMRQGVAAFASDAPFHPVRDYLDSLTWDGTPRLDHFLSRYFGAEQSEYSSAIGRCTLIAAVARVRQPGCKADNMLILEGEQGRRKSTALRVLASDAWFLSDKLKPDDKDTALKLRGRWIIEAGELVGMGKADAADMKAWMSTQADVLRDPYGHHVGETKRQCLFIGTTNSDTYLRDPTGNRRYWPIAVVRADDAAIARDRDQLWAEASARHAAGEPWWLSEDVDQVAQAQQAERRLADLWLPRIQEWLEEDGEFGGKNKTKLTTALIARNGLNLTTERLDDRVAERIGNVMRALGWRYQSIWDSGRTVSGWKKINPNSSKGLGLTS